MNWLQVVIFGLIEGLTEFLPVSSTAHLLLAEKIYPVADKQLFASFCVWVQLGAILAVLLIFWQSLWRHKEIWGKLLLALSPTVIVGFVFYPLVKNYLRDNSPLTGWMLIIGGLVFTALDAYWRKRRLHLNANKSTLTTDYVVATQKASWWQMLGAGLAQSIAIIPGVSRSGASIFGARALGFSQMAATGLSFVIALPTIAGASLLDLPDIWSQLNTVGCEPCVGNYCDLVGCAPVRIFDWWSFSLLMIGFTIAFITAGLTAKKLLTYLGTKPFMVFGLWRILVGCLWLLLG